MAQTTEGPQRLGGWLLLITLGLVISPVRIGLMLAQNHLPMFSNGTWQALTTQASEFYHPLWAPLIWFEIAGNLLIVALGLTALCFLLMKSRHTPKLVISWLVLGLAFVSADFFLAEQIPAIADQPTDPESVKELARSIVGAAIWIPYFLVSKRVRATFTREWPDSSFKPTPLRASA